MSTKRLALLLCADFPPPTRSTCGYYAEVFRQFLKSSLPSRSDVVFKLDVFDVVDKKEYPPDSVHYDGLLISGARASPEEWVKPLVEYVARILEEKPSMKVFGICFGHQIIARALGSPVEKGEWELAVKTIHLTRIGRAIFGGHKLGLQFLHVNEVTRTPHNAHVLGSTDVVHNQGMVIFEPALAPLPEDLDSEGLCVPLTSIRVLSFQGHPELTALIARMLILSEADELGKDLVDDALTRVGLPTDGVGKIGKVMWGVLGVE
ncbi:hypothetical protein OG21DRAFT_1425985 [Imleria badia]|nr:hypothetical protein OG21DRAFT_1425985 [Imleria badia]